MVNKMTEDIRAVKTISDAIVKAINNLSSNANYSESNEYNRNEIDNKFATITYVQQQVNKVNQSVVSVTDEVQSLDEKIDALTEIVEDGIEDILEAIAEISSHLSDSDHIITSYSQVFQVSEITVEEATIVSSL